MNTKPFTPLVSGTIKPELLSYARRLGAPEAALGSLRNLIAWFYATWVMGGERWALAELKKAILSSLTDDDKAKLRGDADALGVTEEILPTAGYAHHLLWLGGTVLPERRRLFHANELITDSTITVGTAHLMGADDRILTPIIRGKDDAPDKPGVDAPEKWTSPTRNCQPNREDTTAPALADVLGRSETWMMEWLIAAATGLKPVLRRINTIHTLSNPDPRNPGKRASSEDSVRAFVEQVLLPEESRLSREQCEASEVITIALVSSAPHIWFQYWATVAIIRLLQERGVLRRRYHIEVMGYPFDWGVNTTDQHAGGVARALLYWAMANDLGSLPTDDEMKYWGQHSAPQPVAVA